MGPGSFRFDGPVITVETGCPDWQGASVSGEWRRERRVRGFASQVVSQGLKLVEDLGKEGELVSLQDFVDQFFAGARVVDAVVIFVTITVQVVVFQEQVLPRNQCDVTITEASNPKEVAEKAGVKSFVNFEQDILVTTDKASQMKDTLVFRHRKYEGILKADYEGMFV